MKRLILIIMFLYAGFAALAMITKTPDLLLIPYAVVIIVGILNAIFEDHKKK